MLALKIDLKCKRIYTGFGGKDMENIVCWVSAILASYRRLPRAVAACKQTSRSLAESGFYCEDTMALVQKLIDCNARAESYLNVKVIVDDMLLRLPLKYARILQERACNGLAMCQIAKKLGYSERSTFRWYAEGLKKAACAIKKMGYDEKWFESRYSKDVLIGDLYFIAKKGSDVFARACNLPDNKKIRLKLEDAVAAGLLLCDNKVAALGCRD